MFALNCVLNYAFDGVGLNRVQADVFRGNGAGKTVNPGGMQTTRFFSIWKNCIQQKWDLCESEEIFPWIRMMLFSGVRRKSNRRMPQLQEKGRTGM